MVRACSTNQIIIIGGTMNKTVITEGADIFCPKAVENWLSTLRNVTTGTQVFRKNADAISFAMGLHLAERLPLVTKELSTPVGGTTGRFISSERILLVAVLRSGYPMCQGISQVLSDATLALVDIKRDEETAKAKLNYDGLPDSLDAFEEVIIPDPMLATGGSAALVIDMLKKRGAKNIHLVAMVSAPEGITKINKEWPDVKITTCAVDTGLNTKKYIVPGLGDFGDRYFGDEPFTIPDTRNKQLLSYYMTGFMVESL
jgi:uracil phosphoribosyltransferase